MLSKKRKPLLVGRAHPLGKRSKSVSISLSVASEAEPSSSTEPTPAEPAADVEPTHPSEEPHLNDTPPPTSKYYRAKERTLEDWRSHREALFDAFVGSSVPSQVCVTCGTISDNIVVCEDCSPAFAECMECAGGSHKHQPFHCRFVWNGSFKTKFFYPRTLSTQHTGSCIHARKHAINVIDQRGRPHLVSILFCSCERPAVTLVHLHLWPSSPSSPGSAFHFDFLKLLNTLMLECHVSIKGFTETMRLRNDWTNQQMNAIYRILLDESFYEFAGMLAALKEEVCSSKILCPVCPNLKQPVVSLDGNFGLVRKTNSGKSLEAAKSSQSFFVKSSAVPDEPNTHDDKDCHSFKAASKLRSKVAYQKLDITGVFGSICRHEVPLRFVNMTTGERFSYPLALIEAIFEDMPNVDKLNVTYDVACKFHSSLKNSPQHHQLLNKIQLAIPIFHCYGHKAACQVLYSPRRLVGYGLSDGEGIERLWSYMRPFAKISKEMTPGHREDLLNRALAHFGAKKVEKMIFWLSEKASAAQKMTEVHELELSKISESYHVTLDDDSLSEMAAVEKMHFSCKQERPNKSWDLSYVQLLAEFYGHMEEGSDTAVIQCLNKKLVSIEKKQKIQRWEQHSPKYASAVKEAQQHALDNLIQAVRPLLQERKFLLHLQKKHPDGQGYSQKLQGMLKRLSANVQKFVSGYNENIICFQKINLSDAFDMSSQLYQMADVPPLNKSLPKEEENRAIELFHLRNRAREELENVRTEMTVFCNHLQETRSALIQRITHDFVSPSKRELGLRAAIILEVAHLESQFAVCSQVFAPFCIDIPQITPVYCSSEPGNLSALDSDSDDDENSTEC